MFFLTRVDNCEFLGYLSLDFKRFGVEAAAPVAVVQIKIKVFVGLGNVLCLRFEVSVAAPVVADVITVASNAEVGAPYFFYKLFCKNVPHTCPLLLEVVPEAQPDVLCVCVSKEYFAISHKHGVVLVFNHSSVNPLLDKVHLSSVVLSSGVVRLYFEPNHFFVDASSLHWDIVKELNFCLAVFLFS